jgi:hypothetical protein
VTDNKLEEFLEHFGVKGMHWGIRHKPSSSGKLSRKQKRQKRYQEKADSLIKEALGSNQVLINLNRRHIVTGEEFVQYLANGGLLDIRGTSIYARQHTKTGPFVRA